MGLLDRLRRGPRMGDPVRGSAQVVSCSGYRGDGHWQSCHMELVALAGAREASAADADDQLERLERLQRLHEAGALTDAEFQEQKRRILSG